jgi:hypothetical protein
MFWRKQRTLKRQDDSVFLYEYDESRVLYKNEFEDNLDGWIDRGPEVNHYDINKYQVSVELSDEEKRSGTKCMKISGRRYGWNGATLNIIDYLQEDVLRYEAMAWVKIPETSEPCRVHLSLETNERLSGGGIFPHFGQWDDYCDYLNILSKYRMPVGAPADERTETWEVAYPPGYKTDDGWVLLRGKAEINKTQHETVFAYIETNGEYNTSDIYVDDFVLLIGE